VARYELRLYMRNGCGSPLLGDTSYFEAPAEDLARSEADRRVRELPKHCFGALYDAAGAQIWTGDPPSPSAG
jgi:hypothetical protein